MSSGGRRVRVMIGDPLCPPALSTNLSWKMWVKRPVPLSEPGMKRDQEMRQVWPSTMSIWPEGATIPRSSQRSRSVRVGPVWVTRS